MAWQDDGLIRSAAEVAKPIAEVEFLEVWEGHAREKLGGRAGNLSRALIASHLGGTHDVTPLIHPPACRMQYHLALVTRDRRLVIETLSDSSFDSRYMTSRIGSRQIMCDLSRTGRPPQILHLSSSLAQPVKPHGIGGYACAYGATLQPAPISPFRRISFRRNDCPIARGLPCRSNPHPSFLVTRELS